MRFNRSQQLNHGSIANCGFLWIAIFYFSRALQPTFRLSQL